MLRPWQQAELDQHRGTRKRAILAAPRLGKTRMALELLKAWGPQSTLITAPKSVCPFWIREAGEQGLEVLDGYSGTIKDTVALLKRSKGARVVINDDRLANVLKALPTGFLDTLGAFIVDECHRVKGVGTDRGKAYRKIARKARWVRILTGTPAPNSYKDLWGQMSGLDTEDWFPSYSKYEGRYLIVDPIFPSNIMGYKNLDELEGKLKKWACVVKREDVFGPDTWQYVERQITLPTKAYKLYLQLSKEWIAELGGSKIIGTHGLTRLLRFQQMTSGFVGTEKGEESLHTAKVDAVCDDLEEIILSGDKAVIFCRYTWEVETYTREIRERLKCKVTQIQGSVSPKDREIAIHSMNKINVPQVCVVQTQAGSTGISLAGATHVLFVSETFSYAEQAQAQDRIYSPGQSKCVTHYRVPGTIDMYIKSKLEMKRDIGESIQNQKLEDILFGGK